MTRGAKNGRFLSYLSATTQGLPGSQVEHRFSEFIDLHTLFVKKKKLTIPRMPPKRFFDHGPDVINERIDGLSQVLKIMVQQARYDPDLQLFLKPEGREFPASLDEQMDTKGFQF